MTELQCFITEALSGKLVELLEEKAKTKEVIITSRGDTRRIGKTTALIKFAEKVGASVIVNRMVHAAMYRGVYPHVYSMQEVHEAPATCVVIDEGVSKKEIEALGFTVITGFEMKD